MHLANSKGLRKLTEIASDVNIISTNFCKFIPWSEQILTVPKARTVLRNNNYTYVGYNIMFYSYYCDAFTVSKIR